MNWTPRRLDMLRALRQRGFTVKECARELGVSAEAIKNAVHDHGIGYTAQAATIRRRQRCPAPSAKSPA